MLILSIELLKRTEKTPILGEIFIKVELSTFSRLMMFMFKYDLILTRAELYLSLLELELSFELNELQTRIEPGLLEFG